MKSKHWIIRGLAFALVCLLSLDMMPTAFATDGTPLDSGLLTEPFLQVPGETSVNVVWFTESDEKPEANKVLLYEDGESKAATREFAAVTTTLSRVRGGDQAATRSDNTIVRHIWRHEAVVTGLPEYHGNENERVPYRVVSDSAQSKIYTLQAQAQKGTAMKILLTSDIQTKNMCAANIQKVSETVGRIDAVLANGDIVDIADEAYDWFDADSSFFRVMQGTTDREIGGRTYSGGELLQNAPVYASIGNHEVMGRYNPDTRLNASDPATLDYAERLYEANKATVNPENDETIKAQYIKDNTFNTTSWEEVLTLPESETGDERYYAVTIGDVRVVVLEVARSWRGNGVGGESKYSEKPGVEESQYGFGQLIFEPIDENSEQLAFLEQELKSDEFQNAKYKMVMFHWQFHSLGGNQIPAYTDPVAKTVTDPVSKNQMTIYDYPLADDYLANYMEPLLLEYGVDMVFNAHSHLWNRFQAENGMNILETSNNGNTYNAFLDTKSRTSAWPSAFNDGSPYESIADEWDKDNYVLQGDPYGLSPIAPNLAELPDGEPYLMSNNITEFSVLDTATGMVDSYYFDTNDPDSEVIKFDSFAIQKDAGYPLTENNVLSHLGSYSTGYSDQDGGVAEIVAYNADNDKLYTVNGKEKGLDIVSLSGLSPSGSGQQMTLEKRVDVSSIIPGFSFGDLTSVAVDTAHNRVALAVQAESYSAPGAILLLDYNGNYLAHYEAGVQPDMVTFTPDGEYVLSANEGEPQEGYGIGTTDPKGSVTVVNLSADEPAPITITFDSWDSKRSELIASNVLLKASLNPSTDFEPEYIAVTADGETAYVALQEANAIATLDIKAGKFTAINSLGFKDHRIENNEIDAVKDKEINIKWENLMGVYMPDGISIYEANGKTYLLTANEGDASEWGSDANEYTNMTTAEISGEDVEVLDKAKLEGLPTVPDSVNFILGGRSFSIYEVTESTLTQVFDSGSDFEKITAAAYPEHFNASNKNNKLDSRSDAKGPEPESVTVCPAGSKTYAYIGLERIGGVMLYDITNPNAPFFCDNINSRDFSVAFPKNGTDPAQGDISAEGLCAVPASNSPTGYPLLLAANEVSGTVAVYQQNEGYVNPRPSISEPNVTTPHYSVNVNSSSNGSVSATPIKTQKGNTVTITATPDDGNELKTLSVLDKNGNEISITEKSGKYSFIMPDGDVVISATFAKAAIEQTFSDVSKKAYYFEPVEWAVREGITIGTSSTTFSPDGICTRAQAAAFLWRANGSPAPKATAMPFNDVPAGSYYYNAVLWAVDQGIIKGTSETTFSPDMNCSRAHIVTILWRSEGSESATASNPFTDVANGDYFADAVLWAIGKEVTAGTSATTFSPDNNCTRAQIVTFIYRDKK